MAIPIVNAALKAYAQNFATRAVSSPATYGLSVAQAGAFETKSDAFVAAVDACDAARASGVRTGPLWETMRTTKAELLAIGRELYDFVQANRSVSNAAKVEIGVHVPDHENTPVPAPGVAPAVTVKSVFGRNIRVSIKDATGLRSKPINVIGAQLFSFVGATAPSGNEGWTPEGTITKPEIIVVAPESAQPGAKIFFCASWYTRSGLSGPACTPISTHVGFEGATPLAG